MRRLACALAALVVLSTAGCGGGDETPSVAVGSAQDPESALIAHIYAEALRFYGSPAHVEQSGDPLTELDSGEARVVPGFTGRVLHRFYPDSTARSATQVYREMVSALPEGVAAGDYTTSAEDKPALAVTEATAEAWGGRDLTAATRNCDKLEGRPGRWCGTTRCHRYLQAAEAPRISRPRSAVRSRAGREGQRRMDVDRGTRTSPPSCSCCPTARR